MTEIYRGSAFNSVDTGGTGVQPYSWMRRRRELVVANPKWVRP